MARAPAGLARKGAARDGYPDAARNLDQRCGLYANPAITQTALDDARIDIAAWLAYEVSIAFAEQEGTAFISGNCVNKARGILAYDTVANASYQWGKLGYVASGKAADFADTSTTVSKADALIDLYHALKSGYRNNASWLMSDAVNGTIRKSKDADGNFLWAPPTAAAGVATILGKPVYNDDNMPVCRNDFPCYQCCARPARSTMGGRTELESQLQRGPKIT